MLNAILDIDRFTIVDRISASLKNATKTLLSGKVHFKFQILVKFKTTNRQRNGCDSKFLATIFANVIC